MQAAIADKAALPWYQALLAEFYKRIHGIEQNNFDAQRFGAGEEKSFQLQLHVAALSWLGNTYPALYRTRSLLADDASKTWLDQLLLFKLLGHLHYRLPTSNETHWAQRARARSLAWETCADHAGMFGPLQRFHVNFDAQDLDVKCWDLNVAFTFLIRQYYFRRGDTRIAPAPGDIAIDAGSCFGDTALAFACSVGSTGKVHTFDFLPMHLDIVAENLRRNPAIADRVVVHPVGLGQAPSQPTQTAPGSVGINPGAHVDTSRYAIESIDSLVNAGRIDRVDFIKLDVEGYELAVLKGAEAALRKFRPKLAVSLYHRLEDFTDIPAWLDNLGIGYRFFLDHYTVHYEETVLYCIADG